MLRAALTPNFADTHMYSPRVELAITTVLEAHGLNRRKAGRGFQTSHALSVALIVTDYGFDEDTVIAGLLHDTLEDTDLDPDVIEDRFGALVLEMVRDVSEPPRSRAWRDRKLQYIEQLRRSPRPGTRAVAAADKIHNLSKMAHGLREQGIAFIRPFTASIEDMVWYHETVLETIGVDWHHAILTEQARQLEVFLEAARESSSLRS